MADWMNTLMTVRDSLFAVSPVISQAAGAFLVTAIWQGAVVAAFLTVCLKLSSRISASLRFAVWTAGFLAVIALPFLPLVLRFAAAPTTQATHAAVRLAISAPKPLLQLDIRWSTAIALLWISASLYRAVDLAIHSIRLRKLWKHAAPIALNEVELAKPVRLRGRREIQVCTTTELDRPSVIGFLSPRILIPEWLFSRLTVGELDQILLHETEHLRRGDDWTNLLQKLSLVVFPLNPVLLWMERQLCLAREMACDEAVIRVTRAPKAYAACLTGLAEHGMRRMAEALSLGAWQRRPELAHRVHSILQRKQMLRPLAARSVLAALACGLGFGSVELARCPQLVAFTPEHLPETAHSDMAMHTRSPRLINTALAGPMHTLRAMPAVASSSNRPYMTQLKATMPVRDSDSFAETDSAPILDREANQTASTRKLSALAPPGSLARTESSHEPSQELLKAQIPDSATSEPQKSQQQSWVVLTTWEEVDFANASEAPSIGTDGPQPDNTAGQPGNQANVKPTSQVTVTRLIFRVIPATSLTPAAAMPVRGGWLVIQL
ncbi:M56 family metallopeptidase [Acidicapsa acidisoli]|uniref:M56 family metallopeptidase n=1 Tax=Acidicapsa acidisoli TaxID=1615681 RepID=UPI0021DFC285|nr:M56 family metallopeptidase [Acidicapsa acidisoli]